MERFINLIEKGVITLRIVTLGTFVVCIIMWMNGIPFPETLNYTWKIILPFWFGTEGMKIAYEGMKEAYEKEHEAHMRLQEKMKGAGKDE
jgi:hypothetical protein